MNKMRETKAEGKAHTADSLIIDPLKNGLKCFFFLFKGHHREILADTWETLLFEMQGHMLNRIKLSTGVNGLISLKLVEVK